MIERIDCNNMTVIKCDICDVESRQFNAIYKVYADGDHERAKICGDCIVTLHTFWVTYND